MRIQRVLSLQVLVITVCILIVSTLGNPRPDYFDRETNPDLSQWAEQNQDQVYEMADRLRTEYNRAVTQHSDQNLSGETTGCKTTCLPSTTWVSHTGKTQDEIKQIAKEMTSKLVNDLNSGKIVYNQITQPNWFENYAANELHLLQNQHQNNFGAQIHIPQGSYYHKSEKKQVYEYTQGGGNIQPTYIFKPAVTTYEEKKQETQEHSSSGYPTVYYGHGETVEKIEKLQEERKDVETIAHVPVYTDSYFQAIDRKGRKKVNRRPTAAPAIHVSYNKQEENAFAQNVHNVYPTTVPVTVSHKEQHIANVEKQTIPIIYKYGNNERRTEQTHRNRTTSSTYRRPLTSTTSSRNTTTTRVETHTRRPTVYSESKHNIYKHLKTDDGHVPNYKPRVVHNESKVSDYYGFGVESIAAQTIDSDHTVSSKHQQKVDQSQINYRPAYVGHQSRYNRTHGFNYTRPGYVIPSGSSQTSQTSQTTQTSHQGHPGYAIIGGGQTSQTSQSTQTSQSQQNRPGYVVVGGAGNSQVESFGKITETVQHKRPGYVVIGGGQQSSGISQSSQSAQQTSRPGYIVSGGGGGSNVIQTSYTNRTTQEMRPGYIIRPGSNSNQISQTSQTSQQIIQPGFGITGGDSSQTETYHSGQTSQQGVRPGYVVVKVEGPQTAESTHISETSQQNTRPGFVITGGGGSRIFESSHTSQTSQQGTRPGYIITGGGGSQTVETSQSSQTSQQGGRPGYVMVTGGGGSQTVETSHTSQTSQGTRPGYVITGGGGSQTVETSHSSQISQQGGRPGYVMVTGGGGSQTVENSHTSQTTQQGTRPGYIITGGGGSQTVETSQSSQTTQQGGRPGYVVVTGGGGSQTVETSQTSQTSQQGTRPGYIITGGGGSQTVETSQSSQTSQQGGRPGYVVVTGGGGSQTVESSQTSQTSQQGTRPGYIITGGGGSQTVETSQSSQTSQQGGRPGYVVVTGGGGSQTVETSETSQTSQQGTRPGYIITGGGGSQTVETSQSSQTSQQGGRPGYVVVTGGGGSQTVETSQTSQTSQQGTRPGYFITGSGGSQTVETSQSSQTSQQGGRPGYVVVTGGGGSQTVETSHTSQTSQEEKQSEFIVTGVGNSQIIETTHSSETLQQGGRPGYVVITSGGESQIVESSHTSQNTQQGTRPGYVISSGNEQTVESSHFNQTSQQSGRPGYVVVAGGGASQTVESTHTNQITQQGARPGFVIAGGGAQTIESSHVNQTTEFNRPGYVITGGGNSQTSQSTHSSQTTQHTGPGYLITGGGSQTVEIAHSNQSSQQTTKPGYIIAGGGSQTIESTQTNQAAQQSRPGFVVIGSGGQTSQISQIDQTSQQNSRPGFIVTGGGSQTVESTYSNQTSEQTSRPGYVITGGGGSQTIQTSQSSHSGNKTGPGYVVIGGQGQSSQITKTNQTSEHLSRPGYIITGGGGSQTIETTQINQNSQENRPGYVVVGGGGISQTSQTSQSNQSSVQGNPGYIVVDGGSYQNYSQEFITHLNQTGGSVHIANGSYVSGLGFNEIDTNWTSITTNKKPHVIISKDRGDQPPNQFDDYYDSEEYVEKEPGIGFYPTGLKPEIGLLVTGRPPTTNQQNQLNIHGSHGSHSSQSQSSHHNQRNHQSHVYPGSGVITTHGHHTHTIGTLPGDSRPFLEDHHVDKQLVEEGSSHNIHNSQNYIRDNELRESYGFNKSKHHHESDEHRHSDIRHGQHQQSHSTQQHHSGSHQHAHRHHHGDRQAGKSEFYIITRDGRRQNVSRHEHEEMLKTQISLLIENFARTVEKDIQSIHPDEDKEAMQVEIVSDNMEQLLLQIKSLIGDDPDTKQMIEHLFNKDLETYQKKYRVKRSFPNLGFGGRTSKATASSHSTRSNHGMHIGADLENGLSNTGLLSGRVGRLPPFGFSGNINTGNYPMGRNTYNPYDVTQTHNTLDTQSSYDLTQQTQTEDFSQFSLGLTLQPARSPGSNPDSEQKYLEEDFSMFQLTNKPGSSNIYSDTNDNQQILNEDLTQFLNNNQQSQNLNTQTHVILPAPPVYRTNNVNQGAYYSIYQPTIPSDPISPFIQYGKNLSPGKVKAPGTCCWQPGSPNYQPIGSKISLTGISVGPVSQKTDQVIPTSPIYEAIDKPSILSQNIVGPAKQNTSDTYITNNKPSPSNKLFENKPSVIEKRPSGKFIVSQDKDPKRYNWQPGGSIHQTIDTAADLKNVDTTVEPIRYESPQPCQTNPETPINPAYTPIDLLPQTIGLDKPKESMGFVIDLPKYHPATQPDHPDGQFLVDILQTTNPEGQFTMPEGTIYQSHYTPKQPIIKPTDQSEVIPSKPDVEPIYRPGTSQPTHSDEEFMVDVQQTSYPIYTEEQLPSKVQESGSSGYPDESTYQSQQKQPTLNSTGQTRQIPSKPVDKLQPNLPDEQFSNNVQQTSYPIYTDEHLPSNVQHSGSPGYPEGSIYQSHYTPKTPIIKPTGQSGVIPSKPVNVPIYKPGYPKLQESDSPGYLDGSTYQSHYTPKQPTLNSTGQTRLIPSKPVDSIYKPDKLQPTHPDEQFTDDVQQSSNPIYTEEQLPINVEQSGGPRYPDGSLYQSHYTPKQPVIKPTGQYEVIPSKPVVEPIYRPETSQSSHSEEEFTADDLQTSYPIYTEQLPSNVQQSGSPGYPDGSFYQSHFTPQQSTIKPTDQSGLIPPKLVNVPIYKPGYPKLQESGSPGYSDGTTYQSHYTPEQPTLNSTGQTRLIPSKPVDSIYKPDILQPTNPDEQFTDDVQQSSYPIYTDEHLPSNVQQTGSPGYSEGPIYPSQHTPKPIIKPTGQSEVIPSKPVVEPIYRPGTSQPTHSEEEFKVDDLQTSYPIYTEQLPSNVQQSGSPGYPEGSIYQSHYTPKTPKIKPTGQSGVIPSKPVNVPIYKPGYPKLQESGSPGYPDGSTYQSHYTPKQPTLYSTDQTRLIPSKPVDSIYKPDTLQPTHLDEQFTDDVQQSSYPIYTDEHLPSNVQQSGGPGYPEGSIYPSHYTPKPIIKPTGQSEVTPSKPVVEPIYRPGTSQSSHSDEEFTVDHLQTSYPIYTEKLPSNVQQSGSPGYPDGSFYQSHYTPKQPIIKPTDQSGLIPPKLVNVPIYKPGNPKLQESDSPEYPDGSTYQSHYTPKQPTLNSTGQNRLIPSKPVDSIYKPDKLQPTHPHEQFTDDVQQSSYPIYTEEQLPINVEQSGGPRYPDGSLYQSHYTPKQPVIKPTGQSEVIPSKPIVESIYRPGTSQPTHSDEDFTVDDLQTSYPIYTEQLPSNVQQSGSPGYPDGSFYQSHYTPKQPIIKPTDQSGLIPPKLVNVPIYKPGNPKLQESGNLGYLDGSTYQSHYTPKQPTLNSTDQTRLIPTKPVDSIYKPDTLQPTHPDEQFADDVQQSSYPIYADEYLPSNVQQSGGPGYPDGSLYQSHYTPKQPVIKPTGQSEVIPSKPVVEPIYRPGTSQPIHSEEEFKVDDLQTSYPIYTEQLPSNVQQSGSPGYPEGSIYQSHYTQKTPIIKPTDQSGLIPPKLVNVPTYKPGNPKLQESGSPGYPDGSTYQSHYTPKQPTLNSTDQTRLIPSKPVDSIYKPDKLQPTHLDEQFTDDVQQSSYPIYTEEQLPINVEQSGGPRYPDGSLYQSHYKPKQPVIKPTGQFEVIPSKPVVESIYRPGTSQPTHSDEDFTVDHLQTSYPIYTEQLPSNVQQSHYTPKQPIIKPTDQSGLIPPKLVNVPIYKPGNPKLQESGNLGYPDGSTYQLHYTPKQPTLNSTDQTRLIPSKPVDSIYKPDTLQPTRPDEQFADDVQQSSYPIYTDEYLPSNVQQSGGPGYPEGSIYPSHYTPKPIIKPTGQSEVTPSKPVVEPIYRPETSQSSHSDEEFTVDHLQTSYPIYPEQLPSNVQQPGSPGYPHGSFYQSHYTPKQPIIKQTDQSGLIPPKLVNVPTYKPGNPKLQESGSPGYPDGSTYQSHYTPKQPTLNLTDQTRLIPSKPVDSIYKPDKLQPTHLDEQFTDDVQQSSYPIYTEEQLPINVEQSGGPRYPDGSLYQSHYTPKQPVIKPTGQFEVIPSKPVVESIYRPGTSQPTHSDEDFTVDDLQTSYPIYTEQLPSNVQQSHYTPKQPIIKQTDQSGLIPPKLVNVPTYKPGNPKLQESGSPGYPDGSTYQSHYTPKQPTLNLTDQTRLIPSKPVDSIYKPEKLQPTHLDEQFTDDVQQSSYPIYTEEQLPINVEQSGGPRYPDGSLYQSHYTPKQPVIKPTGQFEVIPSKPVVESIYRPGTSQPTHSDEDFTVDDLQTSYPIYTEQLPSNVQQSHYTPKQPIIKPTDQSGLIPPKLVNVPIYKPGNPKLQESGNLGYPDGSTYQLHYTPKQPTLNSTDQTRLIPSKPVDSIYKPDTLQPTRPDEQFADDVQQSSYPIYTDEHLPSNVQQSGGPGYPEGSIYPSHYTPKPIIKPTGQSEVTPSKPVVEPIYRPETSQSSHSDEEFTVDHLQTSYPIYPEQLPSTVQQPGSPGYPHGSFYQSHYTPKQPIIKPTDQSGLIPPKLVNVPTYKPGKPKLQESGSPGYPDGSTYQSHYTPKQPTLNSTDQTRLIPSKPVDSIYKPDKLQPTHPHEQFTDDVQQSSYPIYTEEQLPINVEQSGGPRYPDGSLYQSHYTPKQPVIKPSSQSEVIPSKPVVEPLYRPGTSQPTHSDEDFTVDDLQTNYPIYTEQLPSNVQQSRSPGYPDGSFYQSHYTPKQPIIKQTDQSGLIPPKLVNVPIYKPGYPKLQESGSPGYPDESTYQSHFTPKQPTLNSTGQTRLIPSKPVDSIYKPDTLHPTHPDEQFTDDVQQSSYPIYTEEQLPINVEQSGVPGYSDGSLYQSHYIPKHPTITPTGQSKPVNVPIYKPGTSKPTHPSHSTHTDKHLSSNVQQSGSAGYSEGSIYQSHYTPKQPTIKPTGQSGAIHSKPVDEPINKPGKLQPAHSDEQFTVGGTQHIRNQATPQQQIISNETPVRKPITETQLVTNTSDRPDTPSSSGQPLSESQYSSEKSDPLYNYESYVNQYRRIKYRPSDISYVPVRHVFYPRPIVQSEYNLHSGNQKLETLTHHSLKELQKQDQIQINHYNDQRSQPKSTIGATAYPLIQNNYGVLKARPGNIRYVPVRHVFYPHQNINPQTTSNVQSCQKTGQRGCQKQSTETLSQQNTQYQDNTQYQHNTQYQNNTQYQHNTQRNSSTSITPTLGHSQTQDQIQVNQYTNQNTQTNKQSTVQQFNTQPVISLSGLTNNVQQTTQQNTQQYIRGSTHQFIGKNITSASEQTNTIPSEKQQKTNTTNNQQIPIQYAKPKESHNDHRGDQTSFDNDDYGDTFYDTNVITNPALQEEETQDNLLTQTHEYLQYTDRDDELQQLTQKTTKEDFTNFVKSPKHLKRQTVPISVLDYITKKSSNNNENSLVSAENDESVKER